MAVKKNFKTEWNPALQFISMPEAAVEAEKPEQPQKEVVQAMDALQSTPPAGYKTNPLYVETKSRRFQLLMQPSLYEKVSARAKGAGLSVNEWIHARLDDACQN